MLFNRLHQASVPLPLSGLADLLIVKAYNEVHRPLHQAGQDRQMQFELQMLMPLSLLKHVSSCRAGPHDSNDGVRVGDTPSGLLGPTRQSGGLREGRLVVLVDSKGILWVAPPRALLAQRAGRERWVLDPQHS